MNTFMLCTLCVMVTFSIAKPMSDNYMSDMIARILARIHAEQNGGGGDVLEPSGNWRRMPRRPTPVEPVGPFPEAPPPSPTLITRSRPTPLGPLHKSHRHFGRPRHYSESHDHHVNEGHLTGQHRHQDNDSFESHQRYLDAQDRADGKFVPVRTLHAMYPSRYPSLPPGWTSSHEHHVNEGNRMPQHLHRAYDSRQSHELFLRRQAVFDGKHAPASKLSPRPVFTHVGRRMRVLTPVKHSKHAHWYNKNAHFSSSHEHHVNEGNEMGPHGHNSNESMEEHRIFVEQQKHADLANKDNMRPRYYNADTIIY